MAKVKIDPVNKLKHINKEVMTDLAIGYNSTRVLLLNIIDKINEIIEVLNEQTKD